MDPTIDISVQGGNWPDIQDALARALEATLRETGASGEISVVLADDAFVQDLNKTYRGKDKPTNVLSFPQDGETMLGDIIMAFETLAREAREQNKTFEHHTIHMGVHGLLHLLGYDHETGPEEAEKMEALEIKILKALGIKNPYET